MKLMNIKLKEHKQSHTTCIWNLKVKKKNPTSLWALKLEIGGTESATSSSFVLLFESLFTRLMVLDDSGS